MRCGKLLVVNDSTETQVLHKYTFDVHGSYYEEYKDALSGKFSV